MGAVDRAKSEARGAKHPMAVEQRRALQITRWRSSTRNNRAGELGCADSRLPLYCVESGRWERSDSTIATKTRTSPWVAFLLH